LVRVLSKYISMTVLFQFPFLLQSVTSVHLFSLPRWMDGPMSCRFLISGVTAVYMGRSLSFAVFLSVPVYVFFNLHMAFGLCNGMSASMLYLCVSVFVSAYFLSVCVSICKCVCLSVCVFSVWLLSYIFAWLFVYLSVVVMRFAVCLSVSVHLCLALYTCPFATVSLLASVYLSMFCVPLLSSGIVTATTTNSIFRCWLVLLQQISLPSGHDWCAWTPDNLCDRPDGVHV